MEKISVEKIEKAGKTITIRSVTDEDGKKTVERSVEETLPGEQQKSQQSMAEQAKALKQELTAWEKELKRRRKGQKKTEEPDDELSEYAAQVARLSQLSNEELRVVRQPATTMKQPKRPLRKQNPPRKSPTKHNNTKPEIQNSPAGIRTPEMPTPEEYLQWKADFHASNITPPIAPQQPAKPLEITCLEDLYAHPNGARIETIADLPDWIRFMIKPEEMEPNAWKKHPAVEGERTRRHYWRLRNDPTGQYAAIGFQNAARMQAECLARENLIRENEQNEAELQAAQAASDKPDQMTARQQDAVAAIVNGKSLDQTADQLSLRRETVERWLRNPQFECEVSLSIGEKLASARHVVMRIANLAVSSVEQAIAADRCPKLALAVLRGIGAMRREVTQSDCDPYIAHAQSEVEAAESKNVKSATLPSENENALQSATRKKEKAKSPKNATWRWEPDVERVGIEQLSADQGYAACWLQFGKSLVYANFSAETLPSDIRHWLRTDRQFQAGLNTSFRDKVRHLFCRLLALAETCSEIVEAAITGGQTQIAIRLLRGLGML